jgi:hypothetical protein
MHLAGHLLLGAKPDQPVEAGEAVQRNQESPLIRRRKLAILGRDLVSHPEAE